MKKTKENQEIGDAKTQLDRFKQTARELGCDETGEAFEKAFAKVAPAKKRLQTGLQAKD